MENKESKKNNLIIAAVVALLLLGAGATYMFTNRGVSSREMETDATPTPTANTPRSLKELFAGGSAQECNFNDVDGNSGVVYIGDNKMRGDFRTKTNDQEIVSHMVVENETSYMWMDGQTTGFMMSLQNVTPAPSDGKTQSVDMDKKLDYSCKPWMVNASVFARPGNVKFTDFSKMMAPTGTESGAADMKAAQCAACESAPESARAQCKTALGCK